MERKQTLRKVQLKIARGLSIPCPSSCPALHTAAPPPPASQFNKLIRKVQVFQSSDLKIELLFLNRLRGTQEASPDLFHMTPLGRDAEQAGSQPRCTSPAGREKKKPCGTRAEFSSRSFPELLFAETQTDQASHTFTAPREGRAEGNKEPACCRYLLQEKNGCGRKRTRRGQASHRAGRSARACRAP